MSKFSKKGFTVLDLIAAISIITVGLSSVLLLLLSCLRQTRYMHDKFYAVSVAETEIEQIKGKGIDIYLTDISEGEPITVKKELEKLKNGSLVLSVKDYKSDKNLKKILVTVTWNKRGSTTESISLTTLIGGKR